MELKEILATYPEVQGFQHKDKDKIIDFIILLYRKDSPLHLQYPDFSQRRIVAARQSGLDPDKEFVTQIFAHKNQEVLDVILCYLKNIEHSTAFKMMLAQEFTFDEYYRAIMTPIPDFNVDPDKQLKAMLMKTTANKDSSEFAKNIESARKSIYADDDQLAKEAGRKGRTTVEGMARKS